MAWTTPNTASAGGLIRATDYNTYVRDNLNYLLSRSNNQITRNNTATYTNAGTWAAIDTTNLSITLTMTTTKVLLMLVGTMSNSGAGNETNFDFYVDGTRVGNSYSKGLTGIFAPGANYYCMVSVAAIATVSTGSRVFKPVWRVGAGTSSFYSDTGTFPAFFAAIEVA